MCEANLVFGINGDEDLDESRLKEFLAQLDSDTPNVTKENRANRDGFQSRLAADYGDGFELMDLQYVWALEAVDWARQAIHDVTKPDDDDGFEDYYYVIHGLMARTLVSYAEIAWLLRGGFPNGALTRVRTLHELHVTAQILAKYGSPDAEHPELIQRYLLHKDVFTLSTAENLTETGTLDPGIFTEEILESLAKKREDLLIKYGSSFGGLWGWAAPLFGKRERISMKSLSELVVPGIQYFYGLTSSHIHGGSEGWHENIVSRGDGTVMASGPTNMGLALPATLASAFLTDMLEVAVPSLIEANGNRDDRGAYFLTAVQQQASRVATAMWAGEGVVESREKDLQERFQQDLIRASVEE